MSPVADLGPVATAGQQVGATYFDLLGDPETAAAANPYLYWSLYAYLSHGGTFDYQRQGNPLTGYTQLPQFRDVSNFNVGLFAQQAGLTLDQALSFAGTYAGIFSGNARPNQSYGLDSRTAQFIQSGLFGPAVAP